MVLDKGNLQIQLLNKERNKMRKLLAERYYWPEIIQNID